MKQTLARTLLRTWPFQFGHVRLMDAINPPRVPAALVTTPLRRYGMPFRYDPNTYIGRFIYYRGIFEEQIIRTIENHLSEGTTFIDVGANIGLHTVIAAKLVGSSGRVIAFEPARLARSRLLENIEINHLKNVTVHPYAVGAVAGTAQLYSPDASNDGEATLAVRSGQSESIEIKTLDSLLADVSGPCVMKIDVEGGEVNALKGAGEFIRRARPHALFVECIDRFLAQLGSSSAELFQLLWDAGYTTRALVRGSWVQVTTPIDCDLIATLEH
jgi:FkbM family methyltransferase